MTQLAAVAVVMVAAGWTHFTVWRVRRRLATLRSDRPAARRVRSSWRRNFTVGAAGAAIVALGTIIPVLAIVSFASMGATGIAVAVGRRRAAAAVDLGVVVAIEAVVSGLRSGASLSQAVAEAGASTTGPIGEDLRSVAADAAATGDLDAALGRWARRRPRPSVQLAAAALGLGIETGGAHAQAVDGIASTLRQRQMAMAEGRALSAQARLSAVVMAAAPLVFGALSLAGGAGTARFLLTTTPGLVCLAGGLGLDVVGAAWMIRIAGDGA